MGDNVYYPLSASLVRSLTDKLYEKRKGGALEVEKIVRELLTNGQIKQVEKVLEVLGDLVRSQNCNYRKGGLIGLAAVAIAMGKASSSYTNQLILPVLQTLADSDQRVRYYACESLYNIVKVTREAALVHFNALFDTLCRLAADPDQNVRNGSELLDRLLKDVVTISPTFQVSEFMCLLRERIYTKNPNTRRFLVSWIQALYTDPEMNMLPLLPEVLDGCFQILGDTDQNIYELCEAVLGEFMKNIMNKPQEADLQHMANILIVHAQSQGDVMLLPISTTCLSASLEDLVKKNALLWLRDFLVLDPRGMLYFASGYLTAILPCLSYVDANKTGDIREIAANINTMLMKLIDEEFTELDSILDLQSVISVLQSRLTHNAVPTRVAVLRWIHHLYQKMPAKAFPYVEQLFPILLTMLSDPTDEVILLVLEVLSDLCSELGDCKLSIESLSLPPEAIESLKSTSPYFVKFIISLLDAFRRDTALLMDRGSFIIRQLCVLLKADDIFRTSSVLLALDEDLQFTAQMVQTLNGILLTASELITLRNQLKDLDNSNTCELFVTLYKCWAHQPVALVALCLLTKNYSHAAQLVQLFCDIEITVDFLVEIDKLIQLLESPVFTYLRLQLLDPSQHELTTVLYGLLMLIPQTEAFHTLYRRLQCLPVRSAQSVQVSPDMTQNFKSPTSSTIRFGDLLQLFIQTQERHRRYRRLKHTELLTQGKLSRT